MTTQAKVWKDIEYLDRKSIFINEDGSKVELNKDLAEALQSQLGMNEVGLRNFIQDVMRDEGIASMDDIYPATITEILEGILE